MEERRLNPHNNRIVRIVQVCIEEVALSPGFSAESVDSLERR